jgi:hypothetical protein
VTAAGWRCATASRGPILWRSSLKNTIYDVLKARRGWQETESESEWDFFWADKGWARERPGAPVIPPAWRAPSPASSTCLPKRALYAGQESFHSGL